MANRRFIDFPIAASVGDNDIVLIWQDGLNKQTTKATLLQGSPSSLAGLTDVDIAALTNGQILQYNSTTSKWENVDRTDINLSQLGDVTIVAPANGQVLVYNSSTSKWENSSAGYVPYTGAVTTVNLGAQSILAGSFVKAGGTSAQFLKADGSVDSSTYGTGTVTSVALTMPTAFSVANSPVTTTGTLAVTATGTTSQYIRGDGSLETFPGLTGFVPYTGATADVNLGAFDLLAERGTFENNGSSNTLTVNHTSGSGYGIIVTKGGNNEALYVSKTSGSGNAMTVVGGRTSLVDLALSSVTNTAGDFLTLSGGVVHKRTAAQTLTDIGGQAALTNPVTGTGASGQVAYFTGTSAISSESNLFWDATNDRLGIGTNTFGEKLSVYGSAGADSFGFFSGGSGTTLAGIKMGNGGNIYGSLYFDNGSNDVILFQQFTSGNLRLGTNSTEKLRIFSDGNVLIQTGGTFTNAGYKLDVNGTGRFTGQLTGPSGAVTESKFNFIGYNNSYGGISANTGFNTDYNSVSIYSNFNAARNGQGNASNPSWILDLGGSTPNQDSFSIFRSPAGSFTFSNLFKISSTGAATFSGTGDDIVIIGKATASQNAYLQLNAGSAANAYINSIGSGNLILGANGAASNHLNITSGGNVGIGTASVTTGKLVVKSGESNSTGIVLERQANTEKLVNIFSETADGKIAIASGTTRTIFLDSVGASYFTGGNLLVGTATNGASKLRLVGLPTSSAGLSSGDVWSDSGTLKIA